MRKLTMLVGASAVVATMAMGPTLAGAAPPIQGSKTDQAWITEAVQIDLAEIKGGEVAMKQGKSAEVRKLGEKLARAHSKSGAVDKKLATTIGATVPRRPSAKMEAVLKDTAGMKGAAFDLAYTKAEIKGHLEAIQGAKTEIADGSSEQVKNLAEADLQMYEMHLKWARSVMSSLRR